jgi:hypothetical protein
MENALMFQTEVKQCADPTVYDTIVDPPRRETNRLSYGTAFPALTEG